MHNYTVEFRIYGSDVRPDEITHDLGLEPSLTRKVGSRRSANSVWDEGMWSFDGGKSDWESLESGLIFLLDRLEPIGQKIRACKSGKQVWWCGHFQESFDGGPVLSPTLLKRLADFGAELYIDNYFSKAEVDS
jgi:hypothetical protein